MFLKSEIHTGIKINGGISAFNIPKSSEKLCIWRPHFSHNQKRNKLVNLSVNLCQLTEISKTVLRIILLNIFNNKLYLFKVYLLEQ